MKDVYIRYYLKSNKKLDIKPTGIYYESIDNKKIKINSIVTKSKDIVPVISEDIDIATITKLGLSYDKKPLNDKIDAEILKGNTNYKVDDRIVAVNRNIFIEESYQLFRLEFSNYINKEEVR